MRFAPHTFRKQSAIVHWIEPIGPDEYFIYNSLKRLTSAANPESGTINYQYDNNGNLTQKNDARGVISAYISDCEASLHFRRNNDRPPLLFYRSFDAPATHHRVFNCSTMARRTSKHR